jgi:hypothetical protein
MADQVISFHVSDVRKEMLGMILLRYMAYERARTLRTLALPRLLVLGLLAWILTWLAPTLRTFSGPIVALMFVTPSAAIAAELWARYQLICVLKRIPHLEHELQARPD